MIIIFKDPYNPAGDLSYFLKKVSRVFPAVLDINSFTFSEDSRDFIYSTQNVVNIVSGDITYTATLPETVIGCLYLTSGHLLFLTETNRLFIFSKPVGARAQPTPVSISHSSAHAPIVFHVRDASMLNAGRGIGMASASTLPQRVKEDQFSDDEKACIQELINEISLHVCARDKHETSERKNKIVNFADNLPIYLHSKVYLKASLAGLIKIVVQRKGTIFGIPAFETNTTKKLMELYKLIFEEEYLM
jgi:hypothetical protein